MEETKYAIVRSEAAWAAYRQYAKKSHSGSLEAASCHIFEVLRKKHDLGDIGGDRRPPEPAQSQALLSKWLNGNLKTLRLDWWALIEGELGVPVGSLCSAEVLSDALESSLGEIGSATSSPGISADPDIANIDLRRTPRRFNEILDDENVEQIVELSVKLSFGQKVYEFHDDVRGKNHAGIVVIHQVAISLNLPNAGIVRGTVMAESDIDRIGKFTIRNVHIDFEKSASARWIVQSSVLGQALDGSTPERRLLVTQGLFSSSDRMKLSVDSAAVRVPVLLDDESESDASKVREIKAAIKRRLLEKCVEESLAKLSDQIWVLCERKVVIDG